MRGQYMRMQLSADGRYYHGQSKKDGYVFVEVAVADRLHQNWVQSHLKAPQRVQVSVEALHASASFWDLETLEGAYTLQHYLIVNCREQGNYNVKSVNNGILRWEYMPTNKQLLDWLKPIYPCLVHTASDDPICGVYATPPEPVPEIWDVPTPL